MLAPSPYQTSIPRALVHRSALSEVYLTAIDRTGVGDFVVAAQWPRRHYFFRVDEGRLDLALVTESLRQATIAIAHEFYSVPIGFQFLMDRIVMEVTVVQVPEQASPREVTIRVAVDQVHFRHRCLDTLRTTMTFEVGSAVIGRGSGYLRVVDPRIYGRLRGAVHPLEDLPWTGTARSGRENTSSRDRGVGIARTEAKGWEWQIEIDLSHPVLFDHPVDHVPGMLVVEAVRQLAADLLTVDEADLMSFDGRYSRFLDLVQPVTVRATSVSKLGTNELEAMSFAVSQANQVAVNVDVQACPTR